MGCCYNSFIKILYVFYTQYLLLPAKVGAMSLDYTVLTRRRAFGKPEKSVQI